MPHVPSCVVVFLLIHNFGGGFISRFSLHNINLCLTEYFYIHRHSTIFTIFILSSEFQYKQYLQHTSKIESSVDPDQKRINPDSA